MAQWACAKPLKSRRPLKAFGLYPVSSGKPSKGLNMRLSQSYLCLEKVTLAALWGTDTGCGEKAHVDDAGTPLRTL